MPYLSSVCLLNRDDSHDGNVSPRTRHGFSQGLSIPESCTRAWQEPVPRLRHTLDINSGLAGCSSNFLLGLLQLSLLFSAVELN